MHQQQIVMEYFQQLNLQLSEQQPISSEKYFKKQASNSEIVLLTRMIGKINKRNNEQIRMIAITSENIYNIDKRNIKRKISIHRIFGVTVSKKSFEFILHVPQESDYRYKSQESRDIILLYLSIVLKLNNKDGLRIYMVDDEDLQKYCLHQQTQEINKQTAQHPKVKLQLIIPESFQLSYINSINQVKEQNNQISVLFVRDKSKLRVKLEDYQKTIILSYGSLCKIYLINNKNDKTEQLVLKTLKTNYTDVDLMEFFLQNYTIEPFIEQLELCLRQNDKIYFFFKFVKGGDLFSHIKEKGTFSETESKYIIAQVAIGLSSLHEKGIIFGDLKPENILIDEKGYISLTDFGYGKLRIYQEYKKTQTAYMTVEYASPEYLKYGDLTRMSDWYSLGILLFELMFGIPPFYHTNSDITLRMIDKGELHFPKSVNCSIECKNFIQRLTQSDNTTRLGFATDFKEIQSHSWFNDVNWQELFEKGKNLPYQPLISEDVQVSNQYFNLEQLQEEEKIWN